MNWLICHQTQFDNICYSSNDMQVPLYMGYKKFIKYISDSCLVSDYNTFIDELDKFETLLLNKDTGKWRIYEVKRKEDIPFEEMLELNPKAEKKKTLVERGKEWVESFHKSSRDLPNNKDKIDKTGIM